VPPTTRFGLGRVHVPDPRDRLHTMRAHLPQAPLAQARRSWTPGPILDQGDTSQCVAYAWTQLLAATPVKTPRPDAWPAGLYTDAQLRDGIPLPHDGTTVRAGAQAVKAAGYIRADDGEYVWGDSVETVARWILHYGPVVLGTNWYQTMFTPTAAGELRPDGPNAGGHAYLAFGVDVPKERIRIVNSWGVGWGVGGVAWLSFPTVARLLREDGEACTATEIRRRQA
jgi:hypothetical protein